MLFDEGSGGVNQAYVGAGLSIKNFSFGFNIGYMFGNKDSSNQITFLNDTVSYYESNSATNTNFGGLLLNGGVQYAFKLKKGIFRLGAYGSLKQKLSAHQDEIRETVTYDADGGSNRVDSVYENNVKGTVVYPASYGIGFTVQQPNWLYGADFEMTKWKDYSSYGHTTFTNNTWKLRVGTEYYPARKTTPLTPLKKYFNFVRYRAGFYYTPDAIGLSSSIPEYAFTFGAGFPLKLRRSRLDDQNSILNTAIEIGGRGNNKSAVKENFIRFAFGVSLSDLWFKKSKYD